MNSLVIRLIAVTIFVFPATHLTAQSKNDAKYRKESDEIRKQVWAWNKPEFNRKEVPAEYASASKVIIAHHTELTADSKSKLAYRGLLSFGTSKESSVIETVRELVRLNDKSAVEYYSELNFTRLSKRSGFGRSKSTTFIGIRVIKPDGQIKEINADEVVLTKDESNEKQAKVAIPDLQPGDIIDYFIATDQLLTNDYSTKSYIITLFDDAPVLHYSFHGELSKKFAIDYRSYNGAPDLNVSKNDDRDIIIDVQKKNMPPFETSLWIAPARQLPLIRMNISLGYKGTGSRYLGLSKPGEVNKNIATDEVIEMQANIFASQFYNNYIAARSQFDQIVDDTKKKAKKIGVDFDKLNDDEKAALIYYTVRFTKILNFDIDGLQRSINSGNYSFNGLALMLNCTFKAADLEPAILVSSPRSSYRMNEIMDLDDLVTTTYLTGINRFFNFESIYDIPFTTPRSIEGIKESSTIKLRNKAVIISTSSILKMAEVGPGLQIPVSDAEKNAHIDYLSISLNTEQNNLSVRRKSIIKGHYKDNLQRQLILYEDYYEAERNALGVEKSLIEELEDGKKSRKYVDEVKNAFAEARNKQKDAFKDEIKEWVEQEISDIKDTKIENLGVRHTSPDFIYSSSFTLDGLVKKAGNNIIIEIGKIQGEPLNIKPEQRKRDLDIYMSFARSIEYHLEFKIPEGYTAEGVDALNKKVNNETGFFTAEAKINGDYVQIKIKKHYLNAYEPASNWDKMIQFIDASTEWTNAKFLLKKK